MQEKAPALRLASGAGSSLSLSLFTAWKLPAQLEGQSPCTQIPDCAALLFGRGPVCEAVEMKHSSMGLRMEVTQPCSTRTSGRLSKSVTGMSTQHSVNREAALAKNGT